MRFAHHLLENFDVFLPLEKDYEIVSFLPHLESQIILDIGAHKGESVRSFRKYNSSSEIISIEANPAHEKDLQKLKHKIKNFDYKILLASDASKTNTLFIPSYEGKKLTVWASSNMESVRKIFNDRTSLKHLDSRLCFEAINSKTAAIDDLNLDPFFIKIDVEGDEAKVLKGLHKTLRKSYPVLMVENNEPQAIKDILEELGYQIYIYDPQERKFDLYDRQENLNLICISSNSAFYDELKSYISCLETHTSRTKSLDHAII